MRRTANSITWPRPWHDGQVRSIGEEALRRAHAAGAATGRAGLRLGAGLGAGAGAGFAGDRGRDRDLRGLAAIGVLQRDFHVVAQVRAALAPAAAAAPAAHAEEVVENIGERRREVGAKTGWPPPPRPCSNAA